MSSCLNKGVQGFRDSLNSKIYVDKSELIAVTNELVRTKDRYICLSRPRRFGKTVAAEMLAAYYGRGEDTHVLFDHLKIAAFPSYEKHLNKYNVIKINMQEFLSMTESVDEMLELLQEEVIRDLSMIYPGIRRNRVNFAMTDVYEQTNSPFVILIDEWDCLFREHPSETEEQKKYLDFLRMWLKDQEYVGLAYMTGILPIKKYGTHSALNMFTEYSITSPRELAPFFGFTEDEVRALCEKYNMRFEETKAWYDGYELTGGSTETPETISLYNPKSVVEAIRSRIFDTYWNRTETYEALKVYIQLNYDGLKDAVVRMLAGESVAIDTRNFSNDMTTFASKDDVLTLLIHLGYLTYDAVNRKVRIPNKEVAEEYEIAIKQMEGWGEIMRTLEDSKKLLESLWALDETAVAEAMERAHEEVSILKYNDENSLSCAITLAFFFAKEYYNVFRELPSGKGFADIVLLPRKLHADKPAVVIELKKDRNAKGAIDQIKEKNYTGALKDWQGNLLLCGINYGPDKKHTCRIEKYQ